MATTFIHQPDDTRPESHAWQPDWYLRVVLFGTSLTFILTWLPLVRGLLDGDSYRWGLRYFGISFAGASVGGDYWLLALQAALMFAIYFLGMRGARPPFHGLLLTWHGLLSLNALYDALITPGGTTIHGDTLGIEIDVTVIALVAYGGLTLLALLWVLGDLHSREMKQVFPWHRRNTVALTLVLALLPVQYFLLRFDASGNQSDVIGVLLTIPQGLLLPWTFWPWRGFGDRSSGTGNTELTQSAPDSARANSYSRPSMRYAGYGYSPTYSAWLARESMLESICDRDLFVA